MDEKEQVTTEAVETVDNTVETKKEVKAEKTFTRDEVNKMISAEKDKIRKELEAEKTEAERLAKLTSEQRLQEEIKKQTDRANSAEARLNAYELKEQTIKDNSDIPVDLINLIDFSKDNTAELVKEKTPVTKLSDTTAKKKNVSRYSI